MNIEGLSRPDGMKSHTLTHRAQGTGEHVLAELTGPGALVQVTRSNDQGKLSLVVDGDEQLLLGADVVVEGALADLVGLAELGRRAATRGGGAAPGPRCSGSGERT